MHRHHIYAQQPTSATHNHFNCFKRSATTINCRSDVICHGAVGANIVCKTWTLLEVKFTPEQAMKFQRGSRAIALPFLEPLSQKGSWLVNATPLPLYPRETDPVPIE